MGSEPILPAPAGRYDPYDPQHPMWTDPFWSTYCGNPLRAADLVPVGPVGVPAHWPRPGTGRQSGAGSPS